MNIVSVVEKEPCKLNFRCEADAETIADKKESVVEQFRKLTVDNPAKYKVPGFRPKKAPLEAIKIHYKNEIANTLTQELAQAAVDNAILEHNIKPFGQPSFSLANIEGSKFVCEFTLHKQPDFELKEYKAFDLPKPPSIISTEEYANKLVEELRNRFGELNPYNENEFVQMGDKVILDYSATLNGEDIPALKASGDVISVGQTPIPDFDNNLLGMNINEEREFDVLIPPTSANVELANKTIKFKAKLLNGSKTTPMPLNDELAKKLGLENIDALMAQANATASTKLQEGIDTNLFNQISRRLVNNHAFDVPSWISLPEAQIKARSLKKNWDEISDAEKEKLITGAEESIKLSLILEKVRGEESDAQLTDEEVFAYAKQNLSKMSDKPNELLQNIINSGQLPVLMHHIRDEFTLGFIKRIATLLSE